MVTFNQLVNHTRQTKRRRLRAPAFNLAPHRKGVIYRVTTMTPRKPNSARRTFAKVRLNFSGRRVFAKIPGVGDSKLQAHSLVLLRGHGPKDSPGINYHLVRGQCDFIHVEPFGRMNSRSKYGLKSLKRRL